ncbi:chymotrypsin-like elastase family member 2A [Parasteatoda tepidariorum]|uniref:chymotrypsin-like elastase family member 2A n=1 Tax=Parasteatoda tepidariorum TaxID=114398 RepID=UPI001C71D15A|nr:chymotrypsin-like elastase family member 2A [Parasteatoda tepidariorum]
MELESKIININITYKIFYSNRFMKYNFSNMLILRFTLSLITLLCVNGKVHSRKHNRGGYREECPCGVSDFVEQRIINGEIVEDYTKYPWIVGLILSKSNPPWGSCGGVLISPTFVLTAAHCVPARGKEKVLIGLLGKNKKKPAKTVRAKRFIVHPDTGIDLALIELENSVPCTRYNKPICVDPRQNIATVDKIMTIAGFGVITVSNRTEVLREGTSRIVDFRKCPPDYSESMHICGKANGRTRVCFL